MPRGIAGRLAVGLIAAGVDKPGVAVACPDAGFLAASRWSSAVTGARSAEEAEGMDVCTGEVIIRRPGRARATPYVVFAGQRWGPHAVIEDHRAPAHLVVPGR